MPKGSETKAQIIQAALGLANSVGLEGLSFGGLAKTLGMSKSGLFAHFNSKNNLQMKVLKLAAEGFREQVLLPAFQKPRGVHRIQAIFENWLVFLKESDVEASGGNLLITASTERDFGDSEIQNYIREVQEDLASALKKAASIAVEEGQFQQNTCTDLFSWRFYSYILGYHHFKRTLNSQSAEKWVRQSFDELLVAAREGRLSPDQPKENKK